MDTTLRRFRALMAIALACAATTLPACGTMGSGGMKYLLGPPSAAGEMIFELDRHARNAELSNEARRTKH